MRPITGREYSDPRPIHLISGRAASKIRAYFLATGSRKPPPERRSMHFKPQHPTLRTAPLTAGLLLAAVAGIAQADTWKEMKAMAKQQATQKAEQELGLAQAA